MQIEEFKFNTSSINFTLNFTVNSGNAMAAIVSNCKIVKKVEANNVISFDVTNSKTYYNIYLIGESANAVLEYTIDGI